MTNACHFAAAVVVVVVGGFGEAESKAEAKLSLSPPLLLLTTAAQTEFSAVVLHLYPYCALKQSGVAICISKLKKNRRGRRREMREMNWQHPPSLSPYC